MKVAIRYFSRGGNVRTMAEALGRGAGVEPVSIEDENAEITEHYDLLFIGSALYNFQLDKRFKEYLAGIDGSLVDEVICFGSSMLTRRPIYLMQEFFKEKGIKINKQAIYSRNRPNDDLIGVIEYFAKNEITRDRSLDGLPPYLVFKRSQELKEEREKAKAEGRDFDKEQEVAKAQEDAERAMADAKAAERAAKEAEEAARKAAEQAAEAARIAAEKAKAAAEAASLADESMAQEEGAQE